MTFKKGHNPSIETRRRISKTLKGRKLSEEVKEKIGAALKENYKSGYVNPLKDKISTKKGQIYEDFYGIERANEIKVKLSMRHKGQILATKGKEKTEETKKKLSESVKLAYKEGRLNRDGKNNGMFGNHDSRLNWNHKGENHYNWQGGKSFEPYGLDFNRELKERIRARDNFTCQECEFTEEELGRVLSVHHIDYDKKNNVLENLIGLCKGCHSQTNFERADWTQYFNNEVNLIANR